MTEQEWSRCEDPRLMLDWLSRRWRRRIARWLGLASNASLHRKLLLFMGACCVRSTQRGPSLRDSELEWLVAIGKGQLEVKSSDLRREMRSIEESAKWRAESAAKHWAMRLRWEANLPRSRINRQVPSECGLEQDAEPMGEKERKIQSHFLRDIVGNPFRSTSVRSSLHTANVISLSKTIHDEDRYDLLPILGDALGEAGCTDADILQHSRSGGLHVRGRRALYLYLSQDR